MPDMANASSNEPDRTFESQLTEHKSSNPASDAGTNINTTIIIDSDCISTPDIDALIDDGKIQEFISYIEKIDENLMTPDKLQFQEFQEKTKRLRYPSYNYSGKDEDENFSITLIETDDPMDFQQIEKQLDERENRLENLSLETDRLNSSINPYTKNYERKRKTNLYSRDVNQFIENEKLDTAEHMIASGVENGRESLPPSSRNEEIEQPSVDCSDKVEASAVVKPEKLGLSHSFPVFRRKLDEIPATVDFPISDERDSSAGLSLEIVNRQQSVASTVSSDSSDIKFYRPALSTIPSNIYVHEGSSVSTDSNIIFMRSQSDISDLEYIKTRQDWIDRQNSIDIREEIDSDDYHHNRRYSEAVEMLEYIQGREDWLANRAREHHHNKLHRIYDHGDYRILIREEINSDEYHHNRQINETIQHALRLHPKFLVQGSARSGRERSPYKVLRSEDIDKEKFLDTYYWGDGSRRGIDESQGARSIPSTYYSEIDISEKSIIDKEHLIWITDNREQSRSQSPYAVRITIEGSESARSVQTENHSSEINDIIETLIETNLIRDDPASGLDRHEENASGDNAKGMNKKSYSEPFIMISEATDDEQEVITDEDELAEKSKENMVINSPEDETDFSGNFEIVNMEDQEVQAAFEEAQKSEAKSMDNNVDQSQVVIANESSKTEANDGGPESVFIFNDVDIVTQTKKENLISNEADDKTDEISQEAESIDANKIVNSSIEPPKVIADEKTKNLNITGRKDNLEDLIQEGSLGIWFHK